MKRTSFKILIIILGLSVASLLTLFACSSKDRQSGLTIQVPIKTHSPKDLSQLGLALTSNGNNLNPIFSSDGDRIIFVSGQRSSHSQQQLYRIDLTAQNETRLTFQDGDIIEAVELERDSLIYTSTTDEIKERPALLYPKEAESRYPRTELYLADSSGKNIKRLTQEPGFEGYVSWTSANPTLITFAKLRNNKLALWQMNIKNTTQTPMKYLLQKDIYSAQYSTHTKQWLWLEKKDNQTELWIGAQTDTKSSKKLELNTSSVLDPQWVPQTNKISYISKNAEQNSTLIIYDTSAQCSIEILKLPTQINQLRWHPRGDQWAVSAEQNGLTHIFIKTTDPSIWNCSSSQDSRQNADLDKKQ